MKNPVRSRTMAAPQTITKGGLELDTLAAIAYLGGEDMGLALKEFSLLVLFALNENKTLGTSELYEKVWSRPMASDDRALRKAVSRLRSKLNGSEYAISAERGSGYRFVLK
jgi:two-component system OmpR family response regulator